MPHRLLIRLFADGRAEWLAQARDGSVLEGPQAGLPEHGAADEVVLLLPAEDVLLLETARIGRSRAELAQALPYAIEEQLVAPVEQQQVAFDERASGDRLPVAVMARARLDAALAQLAAAGLAADRAYADSALLPHAPATALAEPGRIVLRWARGAALASRPEHWSALAELLPAAELDLGALHWLGNAADLPADVVAAEPLPSPLRWFASRLAAVDAPNLLQGDYRPPRKRAQALGLWRWAAALAAAALLSALGTLLVERQQLAGLLGERQQQMEQLLRQAVPGTQRVVDPVAQLRIEAQRLGNRDNGGALPLLARIAPAIAGSGRFTIEAIDYRGDTLELTITAPDIAALDGLREQIAALGTRVELPSAVPGSRGVEGRLRIRGAGA